MKGRLLLTLLAALLGAVCAHSAVHGAAFDARSGISAGWGRGGSSGMGTPVVDMPSATDAELDPAVAAGAADDAGGGGGDVDDDDDVTGVEVARRESKRDGYLEAASYRPEGLVLGKDRELLQVSVDLRALAHTLVSRDAWVGLARSLARAFSKVTGAESSQLQFREIAVDMLCDLRRTRSDSSVRLFQGTIKQAEAYARNTGRFLVVYIEDNPSREGSGHTVSAPTAPTAVGVARLSRGSAAYRRALADPELGQLLNERFVFFAGTTKHLATYKVAKLLGARKPDFPLVKVLLPDYHLGPTSKWGSSGASSRGGERGSGSGSGSRHPKLLPEVMATLSLPHSEVDAGKVVRFLQRVLDVHSARLGTQRREFEELLLTENELRRDAREMQASRKARARNDDTSNSSGGEAKEDMR